MNENIASIKLSTKFPTDIKLMWKMIGNKKGIYIIVKTKAILDIIIMNGMYAEKAILTPPFFSSL